MKIPKSFKLMGKTIQVEFDKQLNFKQDWYGAAVYRQDIIKLQSDCKEWPLSRSKIEQSFLHELTHWILYMCQKDKLNHDESFIDLFSGLLHQALTTMEYDK